MDKKNNLTFFQTLAYSSGNISAMLINQVIVTWAIYFYAPGQVETHVAGAAVRFNYAPIMMLGYAMAFGRVVVFFIALWRPPVATVSAIKSSMYTLSLGASQLSITGGVINTLYFALILGGFFFFFTVVVAPYLSLMPDIGRSNEERMSLSTWMAVFGIIGLIIASIVAPIIIGANFQFMKMAVIMGVVTFIFFYVSIAFIRENKIESGKEETFGFIQAMKETFRNKAFIYWVICIFMFWIGFNVIMTSTPYYVTKVLGQTEDKAGIYQGIMMIMAIPMFVAVFFLSKKFNKKTLIGVAMILLTLMTPLFYVTKFIPAAMLQAYAIGLFAIMAAPIAVLLVMANAIIADIVDFDEQLTGRRREAMYFGMQGLLTKSAIAISSVIGTQLLARFGMSAANPEGILLTGPFCAIFTFIGFLAIMKYPLKK
jgi:GPH family glycoside/pentoside/hexuronide:cation symporter